MTQVSDFLDELKLERLDRLLFRGTPNQWPNRHVFGGHVVAQALEAASRTVDESYNVHSMHCYFLKLGNADLPLIYDVDPIRDGRSFITRRVVAIQNGEAIFNISVSFHIGEPGLKHQINMPPVPMPEELEDDETYYDRAVKALGKIPKPSPFQAFEMRSVDRMDLANMGPKNPECGFWLRLKEKVNDDYKLHTRLLAYISDYAFLSSTLRPHGMIPRDERFKAVASLDHAMWIHSDDFRVDEWLYYKTDGFWTGHGRGLSRGALYARDGELLASTSQESMLRLRRE